LAFSAVMASSDMDNGYPCTYKHCMLKRITFVSATRHGLFKSITALSLISTMNPFLVGYYLRIFWLSKILFVSQPGQLCRQSRLCNKNNNVQSVTR
jgi:hypothetical protein